jgi:hypothetical protein
LSTIHFIKTPKSGKNKINKAPKSNKNKINKALNYEISMKMEILIKKREMLEHLLVFSWNGIDVIFFY